MENTCTTSEEKGRTPVDRLYSDRDVSRPQDGAKEALAGSHSSDEELHDIKSSDQEMKLRLCINFSLHSKHPYLGGYCPGMVNNA